MATLSKIEDFYKICKSMNICKDCRGNIKLRKLLAKSYNCEIDFKCPFKKKIIQTINNRIGRRGKNCTPCNKRKKEFMEMIELNKKEKLIHK